MPANKRSSIWNYFTIVDENKNISKCDICKQELNYKHSVSNLKKHFKRKHPTVNIIPENTTATTGTNIDNRLSEDSAGFDADENNDQPTTSKKIKLDILSSNKQNIERRKQQNISTYIPKKITGNIKKKIDSNLLGLFILDYQPFSIVEDKGFRTFVNSLNPSYDLPNRHTISDTLIPMEYEKSLQETKEKMQNVTNVCLTTDCWTSPKTESFMAVTCHFIDNFKMNSVLLSCDVFEENHTAVNLAERLKKIVAEWGIEKKIILTISDNASNIKSAISKELGWKFFGCFAHTLNLAVKDALIIAQPIIDKVKTIVSHFKRSNLSMTKLANFQKQSGIDIPKKLILDVATRWNSTFFMLERFSELENCIRSTLGLLDAKLPHIIPEEWIVIKELCEILKYFEEATRSISGENYISASLVIVLNRGLLNICQALHEKEFTQLSKACIKSLENGLRKRLGNVEYSNTLAICTFLDPRFKTYTFQHDDAVENIRKIVTNIVTEMVTKTIEKKTENTDTDSTSNFEEKKENSNLSLWKCLDEQLAKCKPKSTSSSSRAIMEIQRYLEDDVLDRHKNPLEWWKENQYNYPFLSQLVQQKCCALATSVPCERLFSKAGNVLNERRTRLSANKLKKILFLNTHAQMKLRV
ncbi:unnamed protein product [Psylliodes chrysocephalus]|uniref:BED-type domain-containing protein n=1 Tax=Psylliodes chrysocephalus TaxID=3402493 RepID=A0A9P0GGE1_9CUCU|nr:unnamed protein product [Psylliodes chrysocephala]